MEPTSWSRFLWLFPLLVLAPAEAVETPASAAALGGREPAPDQALSAPNADRARALALYYRGNQLVAEGKVAEAVGVFREVIAIDPSNVELPARTAAMLAQLGELDEGRALVEASLRANPDEVVSSGNVIFFLRNYVGDDPEADARALEVARAAVERFPHSPRAYKWLCSYHLERREFDEASAALETALAQEGVAPGFWVNIGALSTLVWPYRGERGSEENLEKTVGIYYRALEGGAGTPRDVQLEVARFFSATGQLDDARGLYQGLALAAPEDIPTRVLYARTLLAMGRDEAGIAEFEKLSAIDPNDREIREDLARSYAKIERYAEAARHKSEAIRLGSSSREDYDQAFALYSRANDLDGMLQLLQRGEITYPRDPGFPYRMAGLYRFKAEWAAAYEANARTEKLALQAPDAGRSERLLTYQFYFDFGASAERIKKFDRAAELFRKSIDLVPEDEPEKAAQAYNYLGYMWLEQETNIEEAGHLIRLAVDLAPENGAYADSLGWYYFLTGDYQNAVSELERADTLMRSEYARSFDELVEQGRLDATDRAVGGGSDPVVLEHLARAYAKLGDAKSALKKMEEAVSLEGVTDEMQARLERYKNGNFEEGG